MFRNNQFKLGRANFTKRPVSHQNQTRSFDNGSRLDWRMMRDMANRAGCVRAALVMVLERRLRRQKQQREDRQASQQRLNFATIRVGPMIHLQSITLMAVIH